MQKFEKRECVSIDNEGLQIAGMIHRPLHPKGKVPAVLMCHGFASNKLGRYRLYVSIAERLAQSGIAALRIDFRGCGESEGSFSDVTLESEISDARRALHYLRHDPQIDPTRIGILGNSFGSAIAVLTAHQDQQIKSLVLLAALFHSQHWREEWERILSHSSETSKREMARLLDGNTPGPAFYKSFFQLNLEKPLSTLHALPLLHIQSAHDDRVGLDQAEHFKRCRLDATAETRWILLQKCNHDFSDSEERTQVIEEAVKWFAKTL